MTIKPPLLLLAAIAALPPLAVDMYLPAIPGIAAALSTDISTVQNSLSIFLVGFGLGMLVFGPLSDRHGRRPLALFGLCGFGLSSLLLSLSGSGESFLLFRLLQGFLGSAATVTVPGMIRDCYGANTARGMSSMTMIMLLAPLVAPLGGSLMLAVGDWRLIFQFLAAYPVILVLIALWRLPETRPPVDPAERRGALGNYLVILARRSIYLDLLCLMLSALAFFTFLTSVSFIYITYFGVSETLFGLLFATTAASLIVANFINIRTVSRVGPRRMLHYSLATGLLGALALLTVNLLELNVFFTVASFALIMGSLGLVSVNADSLILIEFPRQASSASAVTGIMRFGSGALAGPILALIYSGTPVPVAGLILCALLLAGALQLIRGITHRDQEDSP